MRPLCNDFLLASLLIFMYFHDFGLHCSWKKIFMIVCAIMKKHQMGHQGNLPRIMCTDVQHAILRMDALRSRKRLVLLLLSLLF